MRRIISKGRAIVGVAKTSAVISHARSAMLTTATPVGNPPAVPENPKEAHGVAGRPVETAAPPAPAPTAATGWRAAIDAASSASLKNVTSAANLSVSTAANATRAVASVAQAATGSAVNATLGVAGATRDAAAVAGRATLDAAGALGRVTSSAAGSVGRATVGAVGVTLSAATATGRVAIDAAALSGRVTADAAAAVGRASSDAAAITVALTRWVAAQPFDATPYADDTLKALQREGYIGEPTLGRVWTKPGAAARVVRLPRGLRSLPGESVEAIVSAAVTAAGVVRVSVAVPSTGYSWEAPVPAETPAIAVPGLSISALGWANLGLVVACALAPTPPPALEGLSLVVSVSLGASVYGLGKSGVPLCEFPIPLRGAVRPLAASVVPAGGVGEITGGPAALTLARQGLGSSVTSGATSQATSPDAAPASAALQAESPTVAVEGLAGRERLRAAGDGTRGTTQDLNAAAVPRL